jgi:hypothetical protein
MAMDTLVRCLDDARSRFRGHYDGVTPVVWSGQAGEAFRATGTSYLADLGALINALAPYAGALQTYAGEVESIAEEAARIERSWQDAQDDITAARRVVPHYAQSDDLTDAQKRAQSSLVAARRVQSGLELQRDDLVARRQSADRVAADALRAAPVADWTVVGAAMAAAGMTRPEQFTTLAVRDALVELSEQVLDGDPDAVAGLTALLAAWGGSATLMSQYLDTLGGAKTVEVLDLLGDEIYAGRMDQDGGLGLALALRSALALASTTWSSTKARSFARDLFNAPEAASVVGFLFAGAGTAPMGERLTVAAADLIDERERLGVGAWFAALPGGGLVLANLADPDHAGRAVDPASTVLETLGRYPDAALAWLTDGGDADDGFPRIDFWFGERDWSGDEFVGITALWDGMQTATGGPMTHPVYDPATWDALAAANANVFQALADNHAFIAEHTSIEAQTHLVEAIAAQLPLLTENAVYLIGAHGDGGRESFLSRLREIPGLGERLVPNVTPGALAEVFGIAAFDPGVRETLTDAVHRFQDTMLATIGQDVTYGPLGSIERAVMLQGLIDGASGGATLSAAANRDALVSGIVTSGETVVGVASAWLPGGPFVGAGAGVALGSATDVVQSWTSTYDSVCAAVAAENGTQQDLVRGTVESLVDAHVTDDILADDAAVHGPTNRTTTVDKIVSDYYKMASTVDDPQGGK